MEQLEGGEITAEGSSDIRRSVHAELEEERQRARENWEKVELQLTQHVRDQRRRKEKDESEPEEDIISLLRQQSMLQHRAVSTPAPCFRSNQGKSLPSAAAADETLVRSAKSMLAAESTVLDSPGFDSLSYMAREKRAGRMASRTVAIGQHSKGNAKRKLRQKVLDLFSDLERRKKLQEHQDRSKKFREERFLRGEGPWPEVGDHSPLVLGISSAGRATGLSPRRACLLESLSNDEMDMLRKQARYYLVDEDLIDFFTPVRTERDLPVEEFVQKLYQQHQRNDKLAKRSRFESSAGSINEEAKAPSAAEVRASTAPATTSSLTTELMPCMGRHPPSRNDQKSPTLLKVREAFRKKQVADAQFLEERRQAIVRKESISDFRAKQQKEAEGQSNDKAVEEKRQRMFAAEERKATADQINQLRADKLKVQQEEHLAEGCLRAAVAKEKRTESASNKLVEWHSKHSLGQERLRKLESAKLEEAEQGWSDYVMKLWTIGYKKHVAITQKGKANAQVFQEAQAAIRERLKRTEQTRSELLKAEIETKQEAAAYRRDRSLRSHYHFLEEAFGPQAGAFDWKHHAGNEVDRRGASWQRHAEAWKHLQSSFGDSEQSSFMSASA
jgi:hypothetical protein